VSYRGRIKGLGEHDEFWVFFFKFWVVDVTSARHVARLEHAGRLSLSSVGPMDGIILRHDAEAAATAKNRDRATRAEADAWQSAKAAAAADVQNLTLCEELSATQRTLKATKEGAKRRAQNEAKLAADLESVGEGYVCTEEGRLALAALERNSSVLRGKNREINEAKRAAAQNDKKRRAVEEQLVQTQEQLAQTQGQLEQENDRKRRALAEARKARREAKCKFDRVQRLLGRSGSSTTKDRLPSAWQQRVDQAQADTAAALDEAARAAAARDEALREQAVVGACAGEHGRGRVAFWATRPQPAPLDVEDQPPRGGWRDHGPDDALPSRRTRARAEGPSKGAQGR
jgi:hypothetical protein